MMFNEEEALALILGLLASRRSGLLDAAPAVEGALSKIDRVLPDGLRGRVQAVQGALAFTMLRGPAASSNPNALLSVSEAAQDYHLAAGSPCIDTGAALHPDVLPAFNVTMEYVKHQSGTPRPVSGPLDIGAYEFTP